MGDGSSELSPTLPGARPSATVLPTRGDAGCTGMRMSESLKTRYSNGARNIGRKGKDKWSATKKECGNSVGPDKSPPFPQWNRSMFRTSWRHPRCRQSATCALGATPKRRYHWQQSWVRKGCRAKLPRGLESATDTRPSVQLGTNGAYTMAARFFILAGEPRLMNNCLEN